MWSALDVQGELTLAEFIAHMEVGRARAGFGAGDPPPPPPPQATYALKLSMLSSGVMLVYASFMPNPAKLKQTCVRAPPLAVRSLAQ